MATPLVQEMKQSLNLIGANGDRQLLKCPGANRTTGDARCLVAMKGKADVARQPILVDIDTGRVKTRKIERRRE
jgi:hypothetical protein